MHIKLSYSMKCLGHRLTTISSNTVTLICPVILGYEVFCISCLKIYVCFSKYNFTADVL